MKLLICGSLLVSSLLVATEQQTSTEAAPGQPLSADSKTLCVFNGGNAPVAVSFEQSITVMQAVKEAGLNRAELKNKAMIVRREPDGLIRVIETDLSAVERGQKPDIQLKEHDLLQVLSKKNQPGADMKAVGAACLNCGCFLFPGMHGPLILPQRWNTTP